jgi:chromosome segregation ATPase
MELERNLKVFELLNKDIESLELKISNINNSINDLEDKYNKLSSKKLSLEQIIDTKQDIKDDYKNELNNLEQNLTGTENILNNNLTKEEDRIISEYFNALGVKESITKEITLLNDSIVEYKNNIVGVGSGFSDEMRNEIWNNQEKYLGKIAKIQYFEESKNDKTQLPSLRFPVFLEIRTDKTEPSYN